MNPPTAAPEPENFPILNFLLYQKNPNASCLKAITKPTCVLTGFTQVGHRKSCEVQRGCPEDSRPWDQTWFALCQLPLKIHIYVEEPRLTVERQEL